MDRDAIAMEQLSLAPRFPDELPLPETLLLTLVSASQEQVTWRCSEADPAQVICTDRETGSPHPTHSTFFVHPYEAEAAFLHDTVWSPLFDVPVEPEQAALQRAPLCIVNLDQSI